MFKRVVEAIRNGRSPYLFTSVEGDRIGSTTVLDGSNRYGETAFINDGIDDTKLPIVKDGVLIERITTPPHLILCGGGHVSVSVAKIAKMIGFRITVIDERKEFANADRFPDADEIINLPYAEALNRISEQNTYYVIVTRGHQHDRLCLETILQKPYVYCGMIGSHSKIEVVYDTLKKNGYSEDKLSTVHAPIGLKIGANTPEEIAVCIAGEMIQVKNIQSNDSEWDNALCDAISSAHEPYAMVTLISKKGSAPRSTGARMIVFRDGSIISSIGGGYGEFEAAHYAVQMLKSGERAKRYSCKMNNREAAENGMVCGGEIDILIQVTEA